MTKYAGVLLLGLAVCLTGCVNVEPADRGNLAMASMQVDPFLLDASFRNHAFFAREGNSGAFAATAGGCGCN